MFKMRRWSFQALQFRARGVRSVGLALALAVALRLSFLAWALRL